MAPEADAAPKKRAVTRKPTATRRVAVSRAKRKAPTPKKTEASTASNIKFYAALLFAFIVVTSISVFIGTRDQGIIDVKSTISARAALEEAKGNTELSEAIRSAGKSQTVNREVDDALIGAGNRITEQQKNAKKTPTAPATTASSSATSTSATSTDAVGESESEEVEENEAEGDGGSAEETEDFEEEEVTETPEQDEISEANTEGRGL